MDVDNDDAAGEDITSSSRKKVWDARDLLSEE